MSLFDDDDDSPSASSSEHPPVQTCGSKSSSDNEADAFLDLLSAKKRSTFDDSVKPSSTNTTTVRVGGASHFRRTAGGAPPPSTTSETSVFGNSIAAALQLRKETQQELVWQRLERERAAEQNDPSLVEKDLDVAPFVTPAYQHALRQRRLQKQGVAQESPQSNRGGEGHRRSEQDAEDDDPLEKYLQTLMEETEQTHTQTGTPLPPPTQTPGDYYERQMHATLAKEKEDHRQRQEAQRAEEGTASPPAVPAVSMEELQQLIRAPTEPHKAAPTTGDHPPEEKKEGDAVTSSAAALEAHSKALFVAREARKRRRADDVFVESCAARCNERMYKCFRVF